MWGCVHSRARSRLSRPLGSGCLQAAPHWCRRLPITAESLFIGRTGRWRRSTKSIIVSVFTRKGRRICTHITIIVISIGSRNPTLATTPATSLGIKAAGTIATIATTAPEAGRGAEAREAAATTDVATATVTRAAEVVSGVAPRL